MDFVDDGGAQENMPSRSAMAPVVAAPVKVMTAYHRDIRL